MLVEEWTVPLIAGCLLALSKATVVVGDRGYTVRIGRRRRASPQLDLVE